ncbi:MULTISPECIES: ABC-three component system middle component 6 [unclassified Pseudoalteromonas]|uniref:ABC-three component system middle component 6 n=1 Tax=unclassified Pseudoalteromonas TaxID=194690 RepID=UPI0005A87307|nr:MULTISPECIES: ABC-three component system middle component 6 [unclassified Pseudoalteromonas]
MIINNASGPQKSLYVIGAYILKTMKELGEFSVEPIHLFNEVNKSNELSISISYFHFGLDWLYLIDAIDLDEYGNLILCN